ncbi:MAG: HIT family protein [Candidatus Shapirobacteria bacterium]|nr:HIT family protein [Candidatus Shapirobacteria bacterium]MDD5074034.1 HIT family protein [Candidatus Shapirobacteria bacterium]MDD5481589.1 HIT family protein [Candidatus Shapirobacteria bacterium]
MKTCIFCQIAKGKIPAQIVHRDDKTIAFLDSQPKSAGHTLVIPREHFTSLLDIPAGLLADVVQSLQKVAQNINKQLKPDGFNICQNNGAFAGQTINHFHFHIIPRYQNHPPINKKDFLVLAKKLTNKK